MEALRHCENIELGVIRLKRLAYFQTPGRQQLQKDIETFMHDLHERIKPLRDVWHAIEWYRSGDFDAEGAQKAVDRYKMEEAKKLMTWIPNG